jgi:transposase
MLFMRDYKVPFTNNLAERDLRSEKTKEKVSGMFRSWDGIENHVKVRSFISTLKKRGMDLFSCIKMVMQQESVLAG